LKTPEPPLIAPLLVSTEIEQDTALTPSGLVPRPLPAMSPLPETVMAPPVLRIGPSTGG
jgi:hypothetical protein